MTPLERMTPDELCAEGKRLQKEMLSLAERLNQVYQTLYYNVRRNPDYSAPAYISLANAGKRTSALVGAGLKRTEAFDKVIAKTKQEMADQAREASEKQAKKEAKAQKEAQKEGIPVRADPFAALFGPDIEGKPPVETTGFMVEPNEVDDLYGEEV